MAPSFTWLVTMTCRPYVIQNSRKSRRNSLFPEASQVISLRTSTCCFPSVFRPNGHGKQSSPLEVRQFWLNLQTKNIFCRHIYGCFCWPSQILPRRNRTSKPTQEEELRGKKIALVALECSQNSLVFCTWCKHQAPWCKCLKLK